ncbi:MAG TPA: hypothetical protein VFZ34_18655 [Blastocatellia bacterium]|nr:hypothetical protein [Blastocatellia bacterium]
MAINQGEINILLGQAASVPNTDRVFFVEPGNMMTALHWFKRITGVELSLPQLTQRKAEGGFFFYTHQDNVNGVAVNVTIRGGSSSPVSTTREVYTYTHDYQPLSNTESQSVLPGVPTLELTNPQAMAEVPKFLTLNGRVEFKFTNRTQVEIVRN